jgi:hypothetical protein
MKEERGKALFLRNDKWIGNVSNGTGKLVRGSTNVALPQRLHWIIAVNSLSFLPPMSIFLKKNSLAVQEDLNLLGQNNITCKAWKLWLNQAGPEDKKP